MLDRSEPVPKVTARGWRRDSGEKTLCDFEIKGAKRDNLNYYKAHQPYYRRTTKGVELSIGPQSITLGGDYLLKISLTDEEIARLFLKITRV